MTFQLRLLEGWSDETIYTYKGPDDNGVQHNMVMMIDRQMEITVLLEYAMLKVEALKQTLSGLEILSEEQKDLKSGLKAYEIVYKWVPYGNKVLFQKQVCIIVDGVGYNITASFSKKTIKTRGAEVDEMINSLKPVPAQE
jgi:hypothetical protein